MKPIAFYLPQFHCIEENDRWWGKGFTEWTNTKKAKPLFDGHYQPREPYDDHYYDLLDDKTRKWQADIARAHGIYGFCYYHYWFNGKQLLEKPLNAMLESSEPDFPFCLAWANEPWTRAWYSGGETEILIEQAYGTREDWEKHFYYLLKAFSDKRYIRIDNKPILLIYRMDSIDCWSEMMSFWNSLARTNGLEGIYYCSMLTSHSKRHGNNEFDAQVEFEPGYTIKADPPKLWRFSRLCRRAMKKMTGTTHRFFLDRVSYDAIWEKIITREYRCNKIFLGAFLDWDNTARKSFDPLIMDGASPERFKAFFEKQLYRSRKIYHSDYIFINAWNEWAEGTYLEPDKKFEFAYLEAVRDALQKVSGVYENDTQVKR